MKCVIGGNTYTAVDSLGFSPQADLTGNSLPINKFEVRLFTNDVISYGQFAELRDDLDNLWARYWISYAERIGRDADHGTYIVRLVAEAPLAFLERVKMPPEMYNTSAVAVFNAIMSYTGQTGQITLDSEVSAEWQNITINGFCPEQTARTRLLWLLFCAGGYVESYFGASVVIRKIHTSGGALIPIEKTFWKPSITHRDYVTKIRIHAYTFTSGTPANTDEYVTDGSNYWIVTNHTITLQNSGIPSGVPENVIEIEGITLISPDNASTVIQNLVAYYFDRMEIDCDVIDNAEYKPGDVVTVYIDEDQLYTGFIDTVSFSFGVQARGRMHLSPCTATDGAFLTILYKWDGISLATRKYYLPKNYTYSVTTEYLDQQMGGHRYVFRPTTNVINGTLTEDRTVTVNCDIALDFYTTQVTDRQIILNDKQTILGWLSEYYSALIRSLDSSKVPTATKHMNEIKSELDAVYTDVLADVTNDARVLSVVSVDGLEKSVSDNIKTVYINGDHRIDGHDDGE